MPIDRRKLKSEAAAGGNGWPIWIETANPDLNGMTPLAAVMAGGEQMPRAQRIFQQGLDEEARQRAKADEEVGWKRKLERELQGILGSATAPFLISPYPFGPNRKKSRPRDYCVSKTTFNECIELAKDVSKRRR